MWNTGDLEMATRKRVWTYRAQHSNTSLSRKWRINMTNKKKTVLVALSILAKLTGI